mgnify:CR=1 FL=1
MLEKVVRHSPSAPLTDPDRTGMRKCRAPIQLL